MLTCPRCSRAGATPEDLRSGCIDAQAMPCPTPREVIPAKDIVIRCGLEVCNKMVAIPAAAVMHRTIPTEIACQRAPCGATAFVIAKDNAPKKKG